MYKKLLGLNDSGDPVYETFDEGYTKDETPYVMTWSRSPDGVVTILDNQPWTDLHAIGAEFQATASARGIREAWANATSVFSSINWQYGSTKFPSKAKPLKSRPKGNSPYVIFFDDVRIGAVSKTSSRRQSVPDRHHKRKPQPNRGPIGRKEYQ